MIVAPDSPNVHSNDHDLLIRISERIEVLLVTFNKLETALQGKADIAAVAELKERVVKLEESTQAMRGQWKFVTGAWMAVAAIYEVLSRVLFK